MRGKAGNSIVTQRLSMAKCIKQVFRPDSILLVGFARIPIAFETSGPLARHPESDDFGDDQFLVLHPTVKSKLDEALFKLIEIRQFDVITRKDRIRIVLVDHPPAVQAIRLIAA